MDDTLTNPSHEDIIAVTLAGDDEVTDANVYLADRIVDALAVAGFDIITLPRLVAAVHRISHEHSDLWQAIPGCGCSEKAEALWSHLWPAASVS